MRGKSRKKTSTAHKKGDRRSNIYALLRFLDARPQEVAASGRSGGVASGGIRNRRCLVPPFCKEPAARRQHPPAPGGARPRTPQRASPLRRVAAETPHGFNPYRTPQIPYTPYKGQASRCTRRVRAWKGPEHRRPRCQYCGLRGTSRPYRRRPDRRGRADRSAR